MTIGNSCVTKVLSVVLVLSCCQIYAEERNIRALMHWEGVGEIYTIGINQILFQGVMEGILYVETEEGELDGAFATCPISQKINSETGKSVATGHCEITISSEDVVYASLDCEGQVGDCRGQFRLIEGTGRFKGVSGGSDLRIRSVLGALMKGMASGSVVRSGQGIAILSNLIVRTP